MPAGRSRLTGSPAQRLTDSPAQRDRKSGDQQPGARNEQREHLRVKPPWAVVLRPPNAQGPANPPRERWRGPGTGSRKPPFERDQTRAGEC
jgi:hypothetical protein